MNLHYMEYLEGLPIQEAVALILQWISANPPWKRGYWRDSWNSYALSLRVVVWMQQLSLYRDQIRKDDFDVTVESLLTQLRFLELHLETDLGGNHLIKNIKALLWASAFFDGSEAGRWKGIGLRLLRRELAGQILDDGVHEERSASYHAQVLADLLEIRHALGSDPFGGNLDTAILAMSRAAADLAHPDGLAVLFNDSGLTMSYPPDECLKATRALLGVAPDRSHGPFAYPEAGYFGLRAGDLYLVADAGKIGPDDLPAHAHGDVGSFELSLNGQRMIVDQGVFEYVSGEKRALSRAAASHNCLVLDGTDQADFFGSFRCGRRPNVSVRRWEMQGESFLLESSHDGYAHLPGKPIAVRRIAASLQRIELRDHLEGSTNRRASIGILLHPEVEIRERAGGLDLERRSAKLRLETDCQIDIEPAVYWPDMGNEQPTRRLRLEPALGQLESRIVLTPIRE